MCRHSYSPSHEKSEKNAPQNILGLGPLKALIRPCSLCVKETTGGKGNEKKEGS